MGQQLSDIVQTMREGGRITAEAALREAQIRADTATRLAQIQAGQQANRAAIWGQTLSSLGNTIAQIPAQQQQQKVAGLQTQLLQGQVTAQQQQQGVNQQIPRLIQQFTVDGPDGNKVVDRTKLQQAFAQAQIPIADQSKAMDFLDGIDESTKKFAQSKVDAGADQADHLLRFGATPQAVQTMLTLSQANGLMTADQAAQIQQLSEAGKDLTPILEKIRGLSPKYAKQTPIKLGPNESLADSTDPTKILVTAPSGPPKTESELAADASNPKSPTQAQSAAAVALLKPPKETPQPTEAALDARYQSLVQKQATGTPLTPVETAEVKAYEKRKTLTVDTSAAAASARQATSIDQATTQQKRTQDFAEQQAGRSELTNKVEQPYLDAKEKAATLRSVIDAAKNGNMAAGNVQSLLATLGLVTMEGVKRINTTELNQVAGAGSLLERIKGQVSGIVSGKPLSPKLQADLTQLSALLEQSAKAKYLDGFNAVTKRYGLTDEKPIADGGVASAAPPATAGRIRVQGPNGESGTVPTGSPLPAGWKAVP